jgi:membrane protein DedA with SNARE-associated domain
MFGIDLSPEGLLLFFSDYAYRPWFVYTFVILFMIASSFGMPIPEELVLISSGLVAYMAKNPGQYPPPYPGAEAVDVNTLMIVCFLAVFLSDFLVYLIGKFLGARMMRNAWVQKQMGGTTYQTIQTWFDKYGSWCCGIFRFTPGLRFPGHLSCGILGIPVWKFVAIDATAALLSVPTQVWLVANYGEEILEHFHEYKLALLVVCMIAFAVWWFRKKAKENKAEA